MWTVPSIIAVVGGIALIAGLFGGIEAQQLKIGALPYGLRVLASLVGCALIGLAVWLTVPELLAPQAQGAAPTATVQATPADQHPPTAAPSLAPTPPNPTMPAGYTRMLRPAGASWAPSAARDFNIDAGTAYSYAGERIDQWCRIMLLPDAAGNVAQPWLDCAAIGEPAPTLPPAVATAGPAPATAAPAAPGPQPARYRITIEAVALETLRALPGCGAAGEGTNACIVGPGRLTLELVNLSTGKHYPFASDARLVLIDPFPTRINVVADGTAATVATIGGNELTPEDGRYYAITVTPVA